MNRWLQYFIVRLMSNWKLKLFAVLLALLLWAYLRPYFAVEEEADTTVHTIRRHP